LLHLVEHYGGYERRFLHTKQNAAQDITNSDNWTCCKVKVENVLTDCILIDNEAAEGVVIQLQPFLASALNGYE
jgi:hypothetical protein